MKEPIYVLKVRHSKTGNGFDVWTNRGVGRNISDNVVRCALGSDLEYLLNTPGDKLALTAAELRDFKDYCDSWE